MALIYHESMRFPRMVMIPSIFIIHSYISLALEAFILVGVFVTHDLLRPSSHGGFINPGVTHSHVLWYRFVHWPEHQDQARDYSWYLMIFAALCCTLLCPALVFCSPTGLLTAACYGISDASNHLRAHWHRPFQIWVRTKLLIDVDYIFGLLLFWVVFCFLLAIVSCRDLSFPGSACFLIKPKARSKNQKQKAESQQPPRSSKATATRKKQKSTKSQKLRPNKRPLCKVIRLTLTKPSKQAKKSLYSLIYIKHHKA